MRYRRCTAPEAGPVPDPLELVSRAVAIAGERHTATVGALAIARLTDAPLDALADDLLEVLAGIGPEDQDWTR